MSICHFCGGEMWNSAGVCMGCNTRNFDGKSMAGKIEELREALRLKTEECSQLEAAIASSKVHHAYDIWRKDEVIEYFDRAFGLAEFLKVSLTPSTPEQAEAWAKAQGSSSNHICYLAGFKSGDICPACRASDTRAKGKEASK